VVEDQEGKRFVSVGKLKDDESAIVLESTRENHAKYQADDNAGQVIKWKYLPDDIRD